MLYVSAATHTDPGESRTSGLESMEEVASGFGDKTKSLPTPQNLQNGINIVHTDLRGKDRDVTTAYRYHGNPANMEIIHGNAVEDVQESKIPDSTEISTGATISDLSNAESDISTSSSLSGTSVPSRLFSVLHGASTEVDLESVSPGLSNSDPVTAPRITGNTAVQMNTVSRINTAASVLITSPTDTHDTNAIDNVHQHDITDIQNVQASLGGETSSGSRMTTDGETELLSGDLDTGLQSLVRELQSKLKEAQVEQDDTR